MGNGTSRTPDSEPDSMIETALAHVRAGFAITPLHDMSSGQCSCGNPDPEHNRKQGGKHPRISGWQLNPMTDPGTVRAYWGAHPHANVGVVTGGPSNVWVLDIDPDNGGDAKLDALLAEHGALPATRTVRTGSGGRHFYFRLPEGFRLTNSRGRLPVGIDVRSDGGQAVGAGSVSGKGAYTTINADPVAMAPAWLLDMVRPSQYDRTAVAAATTPEPADSSKAAARGRAYAATALRELTAELGRTPAGTRNEAAFRAACRIIELGNAGWVDPTYGYREYLSACQRMSDNCPESPFPPSEADAVWRSGRYRVGSTMAVLPEDMMAAETMSAPQVRALPAVAFAEPGAPGPAVAGVSPAFSFSEPGDAPVLPPSAPVTPATAGMPSGAAAGDPVAEMMRRIMTADQICELPPPVPLIDGLLYMNTTAWLIGEPGAGKSFVALDMGLSTASGLGYRGRYTNVGPVVYIAAEGAGGMGPRVNAWRRNNGGRPAGEIFFLPEPVQVADTAEWGVLVEVCRRIAPRLIVIDTQSRCSVGIEENSNTDMMRYVGAVDALRAATAACVLTVHHLGRNGTHARGASAIDGAQDTELRLEKVEGAERRVKMIIDKQKDGRDGDELEITFDTIELGVSAYTGLPLTSLAVTPVERTVARNEGELTLREMIARDVATCSKCDEALAQIAKHVYATGHGGSKSEFMASLTEFTGDRYGKSIRNKAWNDITDLKVVGKMRGEQRWRYIPADRRGEALESAGALGVIFPDGID